MHLELTNLGKPQATILAIKGKLFPFTSMGQNWKPINMNILIMVYFVTTGTSS